MFPRYGYGIMVEAKTEDLVQLVNQSKHTSNNRYKQNQTACNCRLLTLKTTKHRHHDKGPITNLNNNQQLHCTIIFISMHCWVRCNLGQHSWMEQYSYTSYCLVWNKHIHNALLDIEGNSKAGGGLGTGDEAKLQIRQPKYSG